MIADLFGILGTAGFLLSELRQFWKLIKFKKITHQFHKEKTAKVLLKEGVKGISLMHYELKIFAASCTILCFALTNLLASALVVAIQLFFVIWISYMVWSWRK